MKTYPRKFYSSTMQGAPQLSQDSVQGQLSALLQAVCVDGFGVLAPDSVVWDATEGFAKASFSGGHSYEVDSVLLFENTVPDTFSGEHRVKKVDSTTVWFELDDGVEPSNATSVGSVKVAPLGWELTHADGLGEIIILKPAGGLGNVSLRIDNSAYDGWNGGTNYARQCKVAMVEDVTDINTYNVIYQHRWSATDYMSSGGWDLVGDSRIFYHMMKYGEHDEFGGFVAGYIDTVRAGDKYHFIMNHVSSAEVSSNNNFWADNGAAYSPYTYFRRNGVSTYNRIARKYHQLEGSDTWRARGIGSYGSDVMQYPDPSTNGFYINTAPIMITESDNSLRGYLPILVEPLAPATSLYRKNLQNLPEHEGKIFRFLLGTYDVRSDYNSILVGFDISTVEV